jgi:hypothetical protein
MSRDPIDPESTDWVYFIYEGWLRATESITDHSAVISGGTIVTDSVYIGSMVDENGVEHDEVYAVQVTPTAGSKQITLTHRVSTTTADTVDLARLNIDHTVTIPVETQ